MTKEDIIVLCEEAIDGYEDGTKPEAKYLLDALYEARAYLINEGEVSNQRGRGMNLTLSAEEVEVIVCAMALNESEWVDEFRQDVSKVLRKIATAKNEEGEVSEVQ